MFELPFVAQRNAPRDVLQRQIELGRQQLQIERPRIGGPDPRAVIQLHRQRFPAARLLQATYQTIMPDRAPETILRGVQAGDVNLQRGFVTLQSGGRLQVRVDTAPEALQPTEWQSIPRALQQDLRSAAVSFAYRLVEPSFQ